MLSWSSVGAAIVGVGELGPFVDLRPERTLRAGCPLLSNDSEEGGVFAWLAWLAWHRLPRRNPGEADVGVFARPDLALRLDQLAYDVAVGVFARSSLKSSV